MKRELKFYMRVYQKLKKDDFQDLQGHAKSDKNANVLNSGLYGLWVRVEIKSVSNFTQYSIYMEIFNVFKYLFQNREAMLATQFCVDSSYVKSQYHRAKLGS